MVVRKRRNALADYPVRMTRFDLSESPEPPVEAFAAWRLEYLAYWRENRHPGGLYGLLAALRAGPRLVTTGEVID
jgi:hypothetical protein